VSSERPTTDTEIALRIVILDPPHDVTFALQRGRAELVDATRSSSGEPIVFDFTTRVRPAPYGLNFLGPFTQGTPRSRFVYVNSGTYAGDEASCWSRRAKVPLAGITAELVERAAATPGAALRARIRGRARDGGPVCASVEVLEPGWSVVKVRRE
jgi:hypothetical protein